MNTFVEPSSIVRRVWGNADVVLFIFAGAAAEFAVNKEVEWLFYTGRLPADPIGRLFSTVQYAQQIIFSDEKNAVGAIGKINSIHQSVEASRGRAISEHAYKDVLYMLIYYSIAAFELLERKLTPAEKDEIVAVFREVGKQMHIRDTATTYADWNREYKRLLHADLERSAYTDKLFREYRHHLGAFRYFVLLEIQRMLVSRHVNSLLSLGRAGWGKPLIHFYRSFRKTRLREPLLSLLVPKKFSGQLRQLQQQERQIPVTAAAERLRKNEVV